VDSIAFDSPTKIKGFSKTLYPATTGWGQLKQLEIWQRGQCFDDLAKTFKKQRGKSLPDIAVTAMDQGLALKTQPTSGVDLVTSGFIFDEKDCGATALFKVGGMRRQLAGQNEKRIVMINKRRVTQIHFLFGVERAKQE
jgi:hypothetical protein